MKYTEFRTLLTSMKEDIEDIKREIDGYLENMSGTFSGDFGQLEGLFKSEYESCLQDIKKLEEKIDRAYLYQITSFPLADNIEMLCNKENISVHSLEKRIGLSNGSVKRWRKQSPSLDKLVKVADYFEVTLDSLINRKEYGEFDAYLDDYLNPHTSVALRNINKVRNIHNKTQYLTLKEKKLLLSLAYQICYPDEQDDEEED